jgi:hypothetical protein
LTSTTQTKGIRYLQYMVYRRLVRRYDPLASGMTVGLLLAGAAFVAAVALQDGDLPRGLPTNQVFFRAEAALIGLLYCAYAYVAWQYYVEVITLSRHDTSKVAPPLIFLFLVALGATAAYYPLWPFSLAAATLGVARAARVVARAELSSVAKICSAWVRSTCGFALYLIGAGVLRTGVLVLQSVQVNAKQPSPMMTEGLQYFLMVMDGLILIGISWTLWVNWRVGVPASAKEAMASIAKELTQHPEYGRLEDLV